MVFNRIEALNRIFGLLGAYGGRIDIDSDWSFFCKVYDFGDGDYEAILYSKNDESDDAFADPCFYMEITFNENRTRVLDYRLTGYLSEWWGGQLRIDADGNMSDAAGNIDYAKDELEERFSSYMDTITNLRPYLTKPVHVERYERDVDCIFAGNDPLDKRLRREAMARMRLLGVAREDVERFSKGEYTKVLIDHENRTFRKMEPTQEEIEMIKNAERESSIPFAAYYIIRDTIIWPDGSASERFILPHVWDEKWDRQSDDDYEEGQLWAKVRKDMLKFKRIPCFVVNPKIPEYSEFGELPYQVLQGILLAK
ncbi:MAG: hypothetical protein IK078_12230 [Lachnospiraceae bacterium]|nr:hypothetical protein [Lachnospiraceae bacterium]